MANRVVVAVRRPPAGGPAAVAVRLPPAIVVEPPPALVPVPRAVAAVFTHCRCSLVDLLGALDRKLWAELDQRPDILEIDIEIVDKDPLGVLFTNTSERDNITTGKYNLKLRKRL